MRVPRYAPILLEIERTLHAVDRQTASRGVMLTDSNIRSVLVRAINGAKGKAPKSAGAGAPEKDRLVDEAQRQPASVRAAVVEERVRPDGSVERRPLPALDWIVALQAIKASCAVRTDNLPGSRGYLEFLRGFISELPGTR